MQGRFPNLGSHPLIQDSIGEIRHQLRLEGRGVVITLKVIDKSGVPQTVAGKMKRKLLIAGLLLKFVLVCNADTHKLNTNKIPVIGKTATRFIQHHGRIVGFLGNVQIEWNRPQKFKVKK
jgi:hypothetical protein